MTSMSSLAAREMLLSPLSRTQKITRSGAFMSRPLRREMRSSASGRDRNLIQQQQQQQGRRRRRRRLGGWSSFRHDNNDHSCLSSIINNAKTSCVSAAATPTVSAILPCATAAHGHWQEVMVMRSFSSSSPSNLENNNMPRERPNNDKRRKVSTSSVTANAAGAEAITLDDDNSTNTKNRNSRIKAYLDLSKAKLTSLVVATTGAGFVAAGGPIASQADVLTAALTGTLLCSASAAAWNQIVEVDRDAKMKRTQKRPLLTGAISHQSACTVATLWGASGVGILALGTDPVTAALGAGNLFLYSVVYTYMKPVSVYNTWVGAVVGAIPPVMGWTAATGGCLCTPEPALLAATLYLWQMPHFFALSFMHRQDYARGDFQMVPTVEMKQEATAGSSTMSRDTVPSYDRTANLIVRYTWYLSAVPIAATAAGVTSSMFALEGLVLNAYALKKAYDFSNKRTNANARKIFLTSLWHLPCFLSLFLLHSKVWDENEDNTNKNENDVIAKYLQESILAIREKGRELCLHETSLIENKQQTCPVVVGQAVKGTAASVTEEASTLTTTAAATETSPS